jgi:hypothetical protein
MESRHPSGGLASKSPLPSVLGRIFLKSLAAFPGSVFWGGSMKNGSLSRLSTPMGSFFTRSLSDNALFPHIGVIFRKSMLAGSVDSDINHMAVLDFLKMP